MSVAEANGDGPVAAYLRGNLALIAELERAMIRERLNAGKAARKREGRHVHGRLPYGYRSAGGGVLAVDAAAAEVVRRIFTDAREGSSPARIAASLNHDGVPASRGGLWSRQAVTLILRNEVYCGERHGVKKAQPAIVSRRVFNEAQAALETRTRR
jgi:DNA invertase Pin-like site-specific DNA recombinase